MEKENIEKRMFMYGIYSKDTETYDALLISFDDKEAVNYYVDNFNQILGALNNYYKGDKLDSEKKNFIDKVHSSCIYKLAYFDYFKGEFVNDKSMLVDLFDLELKEVNENE